ncbi:MAG: hypothetical protein RL641_396 [Candidatus Parcubacteria bacterium]|jgi:hypothetical protein
MKNTENLDQAMEALKKIFIENIDAGLDAFIEASTGKPGINTDIYHARFRSIAQKNRDACIKLFDDNVELIKQLNEKHSKDYQAGLNHYINGTEALMEANIAKIRNGDPMDDNTADIDKLSRETKDLLKSANDFQAISEMLLRTEFMHKAEVIIQQFCQEGEIIIAMYTKGELTPEVN